MKINKPTERVNIFVEYRGSRFDFSEYNSFKRVEVRINHSIDGYAEPLLIALVLADNNKYLLGLISSNIYKVSDNGIQLIAQGGLWQKDIIITNKWAYIEGEINFVVELERTYVSESYNFKLFDLGSFGFEHIVESDLSFKDFRYDN